MQKLLRRNPSAPLICTAGSKPPLSSPPTTTTYNFLSLRFNHNAPKILPLRSPFVFPKMSTATALRLYTSTGGSTIASVRNSSSTGSSRFSSTNSFRICRCTVDGSVRFRACIVFKESMSGSRSAWFHTVSDKGFSVEAKAVNTSEDDVVNADEVEKRGLLAETEEKPLKLQRRQRGLVTSGNSPASAPPANPDLLTIPGVGPRNLKKLVKKGIRAVAELKQIYKDKFSGTSSEKMVEFLQSSVGIIHRNHAESITTYIKESVDEEDSNDKNSNSDVRPSQKKRLTFCVEGNISVGKTTFLQRIANETLELRDLVEIVPEPIDKWQDVGPDHFNILDAFYAEPQRYAYTFQNYVFVTRVMQEKESSGGFKPLRLMERSVFSDRMVFVRAVHEANWMNEMEISIYDSWFDPVVSSLPGLIPDGFIYLRATPDTCHKRMMLRKRAEEGGVSLEYLRDLHEKHESWLFPFESGNHGVLSVSKLPLHMDRSLHPEIRDRVFYLEGDHMHSSIQKVPALVLDCEPNIDFSKDIDAKRQYARQVAEFFEFVKKKQDTAASTNDGAANAGRQPPQVLLPHQGGLWVPNHGKPFPQSLDSLDFRRTMSYFSG